MESATPKAVSPPTAMKMLGRQVDRSGFWRMINIRSIPLNSVIYLHDGGARAMTGFSRKHPG